MIMRLFDTSDYERSLRRRRLLAFALLAVGLTGILCYFFLISGSDSLSDYAQGFYLGASCGISIGSVFLLVRMQYLLTHPDARKKAKVKEQDEREKTIVNQAFQFAGYCTFFLAAASMLVLVAVSREAALAVLSVMIVYSVTWLCSMLYLSKKL